ncbi:MAG: hypothetical protein UU22_C0004G0014 [Parcubacteria group bacterium GW2011_GWA2_40_8]|nr:MAG: hypothetical protein UU22_C0004G0014 [Parcubacteria group bacterium GW2011_GWA2_40_8]
MAKPKSDIKNEELSIRDQKIKTLEGTVSELWALTVFPAVVL